MGWPRRQKHLRPDGLDIIGGFGRGGVAIRRNRDLALQNDNAVEPNPRLKSYCCKDASAPEQ